MSFMRARPSLRPARGAHGLSTTVADTEVAQVERLNLILENLGVSPSRPSAQLHSHPEAMHLLSPADLTYLAQHASLLTEHRDVRCDFKALDMILWANLGRVEKLLDELAMAHSAATAAEGGQSLRSSDARPSAKAPQTPARLADLLLPSLAAASRVTHILRAFEEPTARAARATQETRVNTEDVCLATRLSEKLGLLLRELVSTSTDTGTLSVVKHYDAARHQLLRTGEVLLCSLWRLVAMVAAGREGVDLAPILTLFHDPAQWKLSGIGVLTTESYCEAVVSLAQTLFVRRHEYDNGDEVAARILFDRLAQRPPFHLATFKLLHFSVRAYRAVASASTEPPRTAHLGVLLLHGHVRMAIGRGLTLEGVARATDGSQAAGAARETNRRLEAASVGCRRALSRLLARLANDRDAHSGQGKDAPLSFGQLLVLAAVNGMPEADLTDDEGLVRRARATGLVDPVCTAGQAVLDPDFLRLLMGYAYTVPTSRDTVEHASLSDASVVALYGAMAKYIFQIPSFREALAGSPHGPIPRVNPLFTHPLLTPHRLLELMVRRCTGPGGPSTEAGDGVGAEGGPTTPRQDSSLASTIQDLVQCDVGTVYEVNDRLHEIALGDRAAGPAAPAGSASLFSAVPEPTRAVSALTAMLLFTFLDDAALLRRVRLTPALDAAARIYAVTATSAPPREEAPRLQAMRHHILGRMQRRLADVPQHMSAPEVQRVLTDRLLVLAQPAKVKHPNRLRLALLEAYLRSMATSTAAFSVSDALMLAHWVDVALPCLTSRYSAALATAGHDFFVAPFIAQKAVSPLFVPTYVAVLIPTDHAEGDDGFTLGAPAFLSPGSRRYGEPAMPLLKHFATTVRTACQGLERCDATALQEMLGDENSAVARCIAANAGGAGDASLAALRKLTPTSAVLLIASALFDKLCQLWNTDPGRVRDAQQRFATYFSALANLLQCTNTQVLHRVCASIEAIEVEHLRGAGQAQLQFLKYVGLVVDNVRGNSKKGVAEWYLRLREKVTREGKRPSKL